MSQVNINRVVLTGNLTRDPELRETSSGTLVCNLRVATTTQRKSSDGESYEDKPNYFNVTVWGANGENAAKHLCKGRPVALDGRLDWHQWEDADGAARNAVEIVADSIQFLNSPAAPSAENHRAPRRETRRNSARGRQAQMRYAAQP
jgi:single-strand DNA-binding protein